jgi:hypothetical protein
MKANDVMRFVYLFAAVIVLVLILVFSNMRERSVEKRREAALQPFFTAKPADAGYVLIKQGTREVELTKTDGKWFVQLPGKLFPAVPEDAADLLNYFFNLKPESVVDEGDKTFTSYNVDDVNAVHVLIYAKKGEAKPLVDMYMGKSGSDYYSVYARKAGGNQVYSIASNQATIWNREAKLWRDKYPLRENRDEFNDITVTAKGGSFTLKRAADGYWAFADDAKNKVNQELTVSLISRLTGLVGLNLIDEVKPEMLLDKPEYTFDLGIGARKVTLTISPAIDTKRYVRNSETGQVYDISSAAVDGIKTLRQDYVKNDEPAKPPVTGAANGAPGAPAPPAAPPAGPAAPPPPAGK